MDGGYGTRSGLDLKPVESHGHSRADANRFHQGMIYKSCQDDMNAH